MPLILVTNDDGISSPGIKVLAKTLKTIGEVFIVAPESEQSAVAHSLTLHRPLKYEKVSKNTYHLNGTPTDCVIIAVKKLLPQKPDIIVSGINNGANLGDDVTYSGTVAAAMEGTLLGVPSIAISLVKDDWYGQNLKKSASGLLTAANYAREIVAKALDRGLPADTLLNVNVPERKKIEGVRITKQGKHIYEDAIKELSDPRGRKHYWIGGGAPHWESVKDTDLEAVNNGYISVTPVHLDLTNYKAIKFMKNNWEIEGNME